MIKQHNESDSVNFHAKNVRVLRSRAVLKKSRRFPGGLVADHQSSQGMGPWMVLRRVCR